MEVQLRLQPLMRPPVSLKLNNGRLFLPIPRHNIVGTEPALKAARPVAGAQRADGARECVKACQASRQASTIASQPL